MADLEKSKHKSFKIAQPESRLLAIIIFGVLNIQFNPV